MIPEARSQGYKVNMNKSIKKVVERGFWIGHDRCGEVKKMGHLYVPFLKYFHLHCGHSGELYSAIQPFNSDGFDKAFVVVRLVERIYPDHSPPAR